MPNNNDKNEAMLDFLGRISEKLTGCEHAYFNVASNALHVYDIDLCTEALSEIRHALRQFGKLHFVSVDDLDSVKRLIKMEQFFLNSINLNNFGFSNYKSFIHPALLAYAKIEVQLDTLEIKSNDLAFRGYQLAASEAKSVVFKIRDLNNWHFNENKFDYYVYKAKAYQIINDSLPVLEQHRGYKNIVINLIVLILTAGTAFLIHKACTGHFLFFKKTDSAEQLDELKQTISASQPTVTLSTKIPL